MVNQLSNTDFDFVPADAPSVGFPLNLAEIMSGLIVADEPLFTAAEEKVLGDPGSHSVRGEHHEVLCVRSADSKLAPPGSRVIWSSIPARQVGPAGPYRAR